jgi:ParB family transcriptional regulator, chromosome partitioning protein
VADRPRGMGRGLAAILTSAEPMAGGELREVPVDLVGPSPNQPRQQWNEEALVALADSVRARGILQPVLVRPVPGGRYELIAGERRWRAARLAELETIPALVRPDDDAGSLEIALVENMAREDLSPVEEARACATLVEELGLTREEVGRRVGRSRVAVSNLMRLLDLPDEALALLAAGDLTEGHGRALLLCAEHSERRRLARAAVDGGWSVRELEARAREAGTPADEVRVTRTPRTPLHPDLADGLERVGDELGRALGAAVRVTPRGEGCQVSLTFGSLEEALELARRLDRVASEA